jgi:hypothetical protein
MAISTGRDRERRWIMLCTDGRHVTLGRHTDPTAEEVLAAERSLSSNGLAGWLTVMEGNYYARGVRPTLLMVRPLAAPAGAFDDAAAAFEAARVQALQSA